MTWTPEVSSVNIRTQLGVEVTPGVAVPANRVLESLTWKLGPKSENKTHLASGHKYPSTSEQNREWSEGSFDGPLDYNTLTYILPAIWGLMTPAAHAPSITAYDWIGTPPIVGSVQPQTFSLEHGDPATRAWKLAYGLVKKFSYKFDRKEATCTGDIIGQLISDGITMTANPTIIAPAPVVGKHFNVYLDPTSGALGTTQLNKFISCEYVMDSIYTPAWFVNRANASYSSHTDAAPKTTLKVLLEADAQGMGLLNYLRQGDTCYVRIDAQGNVIDGANSVNNEFKHDLACKVTNVDSWSDSDGIYAIGYELTVAEDMSWGSGKAQMGTLTNLIASL